MIIKYITELLFDHECVIIPGFGAFITKEVPATLDYVNHSLTPPTKELAFNGQLTSDDGLLVGYVAQREGVTSTEAAKMVHDFAMSSLAVIEASSVLRLDGMGVLSRVTNKGYVFQLDSELNLFGDAYGLTTLKVQPVYRKETYQNIAVQIATEQKEKNTPITAIDEKPEPGPHRVTRHNYKWFRAAAYSLVVAMFLVLLGWGADKTDSRFASWNPFFYASPNEFIAKHIGSSIFNVEPTVVLNIEKVGAMLIEPETETSYIENVNPELLKPVDDRVYYIIGSSLKNEKDAKRCVNKFKKQGFENAEALPMNDKGNIRVAYESVMGYTVAIKRLEIIKTENNADAWLLRKK